MGGFGSGRSGWRPIAEHMLRLDVRRLHREGWLRPGLAFTLKWSWRDEPAGNICIVTNTDSIRLLYTHGSGENRETMDYPVNLDWTPCNYGGTRTWFLCPRCGRRVGVLFGGKRFLCRHCQGVAYAVENENRLDRLLRRSNMLRERGKAKAGTVCWK